MWPSVSSCVCRSVRYEYLTWRGLDRRGMPGLMRSTAALLLSVLVEDDAADLTQTIVVSQPSQYAPLRCNTGSLILLLPWPLNIVSVASGSIHPCSTHAALKKLADHSCRLSFQNRVHCTWRLTEGTVTPLSAPSQFPRYSCSIIALADTWLAGCCFCSVTNCPSKR